MAVKPKKKNKNNLEIPKQLDILAQQKKTIKDAFLSYLLGSIFFFPICFVLLICILFAEDGSASKRYFGAIIIVLGIIFIFVIMSLRRFIIFTKINRITSLDEQIITIECSKVKIISQSISKYAFVIICIIITDTSGNKYYSITNNLSDYNKISIKNELLHSRLSMTCYKNTNFIKYYTVLK